MIFAITILVLLALLIYYEPYIDVSDNDVILWYNNKDYRKFVILWSKK